MMSSVRHLKTKNLTIWFLFLLFAVQACEEKPGEKYFLAKVNDAVLYNTDLENYLGSFRFEKKFRSEFIREWVKNELLFAEARGQNILQDSQYLNLVEQMQKELASAMLLKKFFYENDITVSELELRGFFEENYKEFALYSDAVVLNLATFHDKKDAINFRSRLLKKSWKYVTEISGESLHLKLDEFEKLFYFHEISNLTVMRAVKNMNPGEVSIVLESEPGTFAVVQLVQQMDKSEIPDFSFVREDVKNRYMMIKRQLLYEDYINSLYSKYDVEISRDLK